MDAQSTLRRYFPTRRNVTESRKYDGKRTSQPLHVQPELQASDSKDCRTDECHSPCKSPRKSNVIKEAVGKDVGKNHAQRCLITSLPLPVKFTILKDTFVSLDIVMSMLSNRDEECDFEKLKKAVERMTRRHFTMKHLAQIKQMYPQAYKMTQENRVLSAYRGSPTAHRLVVAINFEEPSALDGDKMNEECPAKLSPLMLAARSETFHRRLLQRLYVEHREFLSSLQKPIVVSDEKLTRWHPQFMLEKVADIEEAELPLVPSSATKVHTAREVLEIATQHLQSDKVKAALVKLSSTCVSPEKKSSEEKLKKLVAKIDKKKLKDSINLVKAANVNVSAAAPEKNELAGLSLSLIEKVRAKEALKNARSMMRTKEEAEKLEMMQRLPELTRIIRSSFVSCKKPALLLTDIIARITLSYKTGMSAVEAERHVNLLVETLPGWITRLQHKNSVLIKVDRKQDLNILIHSIKQFANKLR